MIAAPVLTRTRHDMTLESQTIALCALLITGTASAQVPQPAGAAHNCAAHALTQAGRLLEFHIGPDEVKDSTFKLAIDPGVRLLKPLRNPANAKQSFDVLEVWGARYKARWRMRFLYAQLPGDCTLMGQEIIEYSSL